MEANRRANLKQIASGLGLSVTTVSRALKNGPEVHPETIARVKAAAQAAGYVPNLHGRALRTGQTHTLCAILPLETRDDLSDLAKLPLIEGMTLAAQEKGYSLWISSATPDESPQDNLNRVVQAGSADGIIITRMIADDPRVPFLLEQQIPFVAYGPRVCDMNYAYVDIDNERIAYEGVQMLVAEGCRRIALQLLTPEDQYSTMRMAGYSSAMSEAGLEIDPYLIGYQEFTMASSERWIGKLLDLPQPVSGLICANELGLLGALSALRQRNLVPGQDLKIVVRDNTQMCRHLSVPLAVHAVDMVGVGRRLIENLVRQIETPEAALQQLVIVGKLQKLGFHTRPG